MQDGEAVEGGRQALQLVIEVAHHQVAGVAIAALVLAGGAQHPVERASGGQQRVPVMGSLAAPAPGLEVGGLHPQAVGGPRLARVERGAVRPCATRGAWGSRLRGHRRRSRWADSCPGILLPARAHRDQRLPVPCRRVTACCTFSTATGSRSWWPLWPTTWRRRAGVQASIRSHPRWSSCPTRWSRRTRGARWPAASASPPTCASPTWTASWPSWSRPGARGGCSTATSCRS